MFSFLPHTICTHWAENLQSLYDWGWSFSFLERKYKKNKTQNSTTYAISVPLWWDFFFFFSVRSLEPVHHLIAFCSWTCRGLWETCPAGSLPWFIDIWQGHMCKRNRLKVRACWRKRGSGGGLQTWHPAQRSEHCRFNAACLPWLFWPQRLGCRSLSYVLHCGRCVKSWFCQLSVRMGRLGDHIWRSVIGYLNNEEQHCFLGGFCRFCAYFYN